MHRSVDDVEVVGECSRSTRLASRRHRDGVESPSRQNDYVIDSVVVSQLAWAQRTKPRPSCTYTFMSFNLLNTWSSLLLLSIGLLIPCISAAPITPHQSFSPWIISCRFSSHSTHPIPGTRRRTLVCPDNIEKVPIRRCEKRCHNSR